MWPFVSSFFTEHDVLEDRLCSGIYQHIIPFMAKWYFVVWINYIIFVSLPIDVHLSCVHFFAIVDNAAVHISTQVFAEYINFHFS